VSDVPPLSHELYPGSGLEDKQSRALPQGGDLELAASEVEATQKPLGGPRWNLIANQKLPKHGEVMLIAEQLSQFVVLVPEGFHYRRPSSVKKLVVVPRRVDGLAPAVETRFVGI
jgi:hypothetical protein